MDPLDLKQTIQSGPEGQNHTPSLAPGATLGQYKIIRLLGRGGMGEVYEAEHLQMRKRYALKLLPAAATRSATFLDRFRVEARVMADLKHPGIVHVDYMGEDGGQYYLVMEYIVGPSGDPQPLEDLLAGGKLPEQRVRELALELCEALSYAHKHEVVHRDLKPANILLDAEGHARIVDFGLAKVIGSDYLQTMIQRSIQLSMAGQVSMGDKDTQDGSGSAKASSSARALLGTYDYMAPEQKAGGEITERTDVFALGVCLYRMLTGRKPEGRWKAPSAFGAAKGWDAVIGKCLESDPSDRYATVEDLKSSIHQLGRRVGSKWLVAAALIVGVLAVTPVLVRHAQQRQKEAAARQAATEKQRADAERVTGLLKEAERQVAGDKLDEALAALAEAEKLDPENNQTGKLKAEIEAKAGERKARPAKVDADMAWERLKNRKQDEGQGMGAKLAEVERQWRLAADAYGLAKWGEAYTGYQAVLRLVKEAEGLEVAREAAKARRGEAEKSKQTAAMAGAAELAAAEWAEGGRASARALEQFEKGAFPEAGQAWQAASVQWTAAQAKAEAVTAYRKAKAAFEKAVGGTTSVSSADLKEYGGATWEEVERQRRLGEASENDPALGRKAYETALAKLPEAIREAESGKRKAEEREAAARQAAAEKAARDQALEEYRQVLAKAKASLMKAQGLARTDAQGPGVVKEGRDAITAFEAGAAYSLLGAPERTALTEVNYALAALTWDLGPKAGDVLSLDLGGGVKLELVWVEALKGWVGKYEVTNGEYRKFKADHYSGKFSGHTLNDDRQPVVEVSYNDAVAFCEWVNRQAKVPSGYTARLPDGQEWLTFAQCGDNREYPWGNDGPPKYGNYHGQEGAVSWSKIDGYNDGFPVTCDVSKSGKSDWGLYGVGGNIWEWTSEQEGSDRVLRGASWHTNFQDYLRCSYRFRLAPTIRFNYIGFRVVVLR